MATVNRKVVFLISAAIAIVFVIFVISVIVLKDSEDDKPPKYTPSKEQFAGKRLELSKYYDDHDFHIHTGGEKNFFRRFRAAESMQQFMFGKNFQTF